MATGTTTAFKISLTTVTGRKIVLNVFHDSTVESIKHIIFASVGFPPDRISLFFFDRELEDKKTLFECNIGPRAEGKIVFKQLTFENCDDSEASFPIHVNTLPEVLTVNVYYDTQIREIKRMVQDCGGTELLRDQRILVYNGRPLNDDDYVLNCGIKRDAIIHLIPMLRGGKPVICMYAPDGQSVTASVSLRLDDSWRYSALYPRPSKENRNYVTWDVVVNADLKSQELTVINNGVTKEYSYLFWEAVTVGLPNFVIDQKNQFCIRSSEIDDHLDSALTKLGLNTRERNDLITYWLEQMKSKEYLLFSFCNEILYSNRARLEISPVPDCLIRVFLLFCPVDIEHPTTGDLSSLTGPLRQGFTVVEWGGMNLAGVQCSMMGA